MKISKKFITVLSAITLFASGYTAFSQINSKSNTIIVNAAKKKHAKKKHSKKKHAKKIHVSSNDKAAYWYIKNGKKLLKKYSNNDTFVTGIQDAIRMSDSEGFTSFLDSRYVNNKVYRQGWILGISSQSTKDIKDTKTKIARTNSAIQFYNSGVNYLKTHNEAPQYYHRICSDHGDPWSDNLTGSGYFDSQGNKVNIHEDSSNNQTSYDNQDSDDYDD